MSTYREGGDESRGSRPLTLTGAGENRESSRGSRGWCRGASTVERPEEPLSRAGPSGGDRTWRAWRDSVCPKAHFFWRSAWQVSLFEGRGVTEG